MRAGIESTDEGKGEGNGGGQYEGAKRSGREEGIW